MKPGYLPKPATIRRECELIRQEWDEAEHYKRRGLAVPAFLVEDGGRYKDGRSSFWTPPQCEFAEDVS